MTTLRQRMIEDMQLRGLAERTQEAYVATTRQLVPVSIVKVQMGCPECSPFRSSSGTFFV